MYLIIPLHAVLVAILLFITEVMAIFATQLAGIQTSALANNQTSQQAGVDVTNVLAFAAPNVAFIRGFALIVTLVLTFVDAWAPHSASGGHHHKFWVHPVVDDADVRTGTDVHPAHRAGAVPQHRRRHRPDAGDAGTDFVRGAGGRRPEGGRSESRTRLERAKAGRMKLEVRA